ncbi:hypothetical protein ACQ7HM_20915 [Williamsia sp. MIQD14]|uniref:hypothetical protein n=1 Tax=Williamsia sp. MIQD14 TaxID=3425703 RepID=UPI003DA1AEC2
MTPATPSPKRDPYIVGGALVVAALIVVPAAFAIAFPGHNLAYWVLAAMLLLGLLPAILIGGGRHDRAIVRRADLALANHREDRAHLTDALDPSTYPDIADVLAALVAHIWWPAVSPTVRSHSLDKLRRRTRTSAASFIAVLTGTSEDPSPRQIRHVADALELTTERTTELHHQAHAALTAR